uniref:fibroblast growth factor-binding protein 2-like n=1 Tax=Myxine glutinosa TaxID=7769 RepID=UPI00358FE60B
MTCSTTMRLVELCALAILLWLLQTAVAKTDEPRHPQESPARHITGQSVVKTRGSFRGRGHDRCRWRAKGARKVSLRVMCSGRDGAYWCEYTARPRKCTSYRQKMERFWYQVVRRLKYKLNACRGRNVLYAGVCRDAPQKVHFTRTSEMTTQAKSSINTREREAKQGRAQGNANGEGNKRRKGKEEKNLILKKSKKNSKKINVPDAVKSVASSSSSSLSTISTTMTPLITERDLTPEELARKNCQESWQVFCTFLAAAWEG